ncbi:unnamed protein product [Camellia sinensis]
MRYHPLKKGLELVVVDKESQSSFVGLICGNSILYNKRTRPELLSVLFLSLISCSLILASQFLNFPPTSLSYSFGHEDQSLLSEMNANTPLCSSIPNGTICPTVITMHGTMFPRVVFVILDYHEWWFTKYGDILSILSDYPPIDFSGDNRTHCFPEAMAGLRIHDDLTIDPLLMEGGKTTKDFRDILDHAYWPRIKGLIEDEEREAKLNNLSSSSSSQKLLEIRTELKKPKLVILLRQKSRAIANEDLLVKMAEQIGFEVEVLRPVCTFELERIYRELNSSDVTIGVHGAALTHFLMGFRDLLWGTIDKARFEVHWLQNSPRESSLFDEYDENDPVLTNPSNVGKKGWEFTKKIYLDHQNVRLNLVRFQKQLLRAYDYSFAKKNQDFYRQSH